MKPSRIISNSPVSEMKQSKDRITVLLTCNATRSKKLCPLFIHKYENPRALKNIDKKTLLLDYYWNQKSWMQMGGVLGKGTKSTKNFFFKIIDILYQMIKSTFIL